MPREAAAPRHTGHSMASFTLHGIPVSRGISIGRAHLLTPAALDVKHYRVPEEQVEAEVQRALALAETEGLTLSAADAKPEPTFHLCS